MKKGPVFLTHSVVHEIIFKGRSRSSAMSSFTRSSRLSIRDGPKSRLHLTFRQQLTLTLYEY